MIRYICENSDCLNTFLSPIVDRFKRCELCGKHLIYVGNPNKNRDNTPYPPLLETIDQLEKKYIRLRKRALNFGLTESECLTVGRAVRKISFGKRKMLLEENGLWRENVVYKHVLTEYGLWKMIENKSGKNNEA